MIAMKKMKVAVIGCGKIARDQHIPSLARNPLVEIKYLVDIKIERAVDLANQYHVPFALADFREMLPDREVEALSLCTPNDTHATIAIECLDAGKNVLCEKPAAINAELAWKMKNAADRNDKMLSIGVVNRFSRAVNQIREMIAGGKLGNVYQIYCSFRAHRAIPGLGGPFTTKVHSGGGVLIDWGVHFLDLIFYCIGMPKVTTVSSAAHSELGKSMQDYSYLDMWAGPPDFSGTYDVEDFVTGLIRTTGPTISFNGAWAQNIGESAMFVEFLGDKAGIKWKYGGDYKVFSADQGVLYETLPTYRSSDMFYDEINSFLISARDHVKNVANIDQVILTSEVIDAVYRSAQLGREVVF
jgi:predicted dehydrogenase